jgi:hypothetical protein
MIRSLLVLTFSSAIALLAVPIAAQTQDRAGLQVKIELLRQELQSKERVFLEPAPEDFAVFAEFLRQPDTGLARLMPREKYDGNLLIRGGGAYYSFARLTNEYGLGSDIGYEQGRLCVCAPGASFGFLSVLGDMPIDGVTVESPGLQYLASFSPPSAEPGAREQQRRAANGFEIDGITYRNLSLAAVNTTYALRSVDYARSDLLVVFRLTRQDSDGSMILAWKILKRFSVPQLVN